MNGLGIPVVLARLEEMSSDVNGLRRVVDEEDLSVSDRQYVSRCFDLLDMELSALRQYLEHLR